MSNAQGGRRRLYLALGSVLTVVGLVLFGGGAWLLALGGSAYYALAGAALSVTGVALLQNTVCEGFTS